MVNLPEGWSLTAPTPSPGLVNSLIAQESQGNPNAVSPKGAFGTMQLMPGTARDPGFGVQPMQDNSDAENRRVGQDYLSAMLKRYGGDQVSALVAYNWGPGHADKWIAAGKNPNALPAETKGYVQKVLAGAGGGTPALNQGVSLPEGWSLTPPQAGKPTVPMSGASPSQVAEMNARQPQDTAFPLGNPFTDPNTQLDPGAAIAQSAAAVGKLFGLSDTSAQNMGRFAYQLPQSLGPLGTEFSPLSSVPTEARPMPKIAEGMPQASVRTGEELKSSGVSNMNAAKASDVTIGPDVMQPIVTDLKTKLVNASLANRKDFSIDADLRPDAAKMLPKIEAAAEQPQNVQDLHELRMKIDGMIDNNIVNGKPNQDAIIGMKMRDAVNAMIDAHPEGATFARGSSEYARAAKSQIIENALNKVRGAGDEATRNRAAMREVYNKYYKSGPFSKDELAAIRKAAGPGSFNPLGILAKAGLGTTITGPAIGVAVAHILGIPPEALIAAGTVAHHLIDLRSSSAARRVGEMIRAGGPVAETRFNVLAHKLNPKVLADAIQDPEGFKRIASWVTSPTSKTAQAIGTYIAGRLRVPHLSTRIASELQGTVPSQAQPEQQ